ncbi:MAG TPA: SAM-dependent methyltransferase, partial [Actinomycetes bacterium]|nr:SAM-dependent methyltransferase [Actinomycetes bacterium]
MPEDLPTALAEIRSLLLDRDGLVRGVAAGRRRGNPPRWRRVELRPVTVKSGPVLQVTTYDATQAHTDNHDWARAAATVDALLSEPFGNWHVET